MILWQGGTSEGMRGERSTAGGSWPYLAAWAMATILQVVYFDPGDHHNRMNSWCSVKAQHELDEGVWSLPDHYHPG